MREIVFQVTHEGPGNLQALADTLPIRISAPTLEDLQHEAREALIDHLGPAHGTYRVRVRRRRCPSIRLMGSGPLRCSGPASSHEAPFMKTLCCR